MDCNQGQLTIVNAETFLNVPDRHSLSTKNQNPPPLCAQAPGPRPRPTVRSPVPPPGLENGKLSTEFPDVKTLCFFLNWCNRSPRGFFLSEIFQVEGAANRNGEFKASGVGWQSGPRRVGRLAKESCANQTKKIARLIAANRATHGGIRSRERIAGKLFQEVAIMFASAAFII